jgi:integrase
MLSSASSAERLHTASPGRDCVGAFDAYLARSGRADATRVKYVQILRDLEQRVSPSSLLDLDAGELDLALAQWATHGEHALGRALSRATIRGRICALRSFYRWAEAFDLLLDSAGRQRPHPMRRIVAPAVDQRPNDRLRPHEDVALLAAPSTPEERLIVWLLRWTGLRVGEATQLTRADIDLTPGREAILVRESKTSAGRRSVPIVPELLPEIEAWLMRLDAAGHVEPAAPLLATRLGTPMTTGYVWRLTKRVAGRAGVRPIECTCKSTSAYRHDAGCPRTRAGENRSEISPHTLRRSFASDLLNRGVRLEVVSKLLGHASVAVTQKAYATLLDDTARRELLTALGYDAG